MQLTTISCPHQPRGEDSQASKDINDLSRAQRTQCWAAAASTCRSGCGSPACPCSCSRSRSRSQALALHRSLLLALGA